MQYNSSAQNRPNYGLWLAGVILTLITLGCLGVVAHGIVNPTPLIQGNGWLVRYWESLGDAQGGILSQIIFLLAAMWAAFLAPMLFSGQLRSAKYALDDLRRHTDEQIKQLSQNTNDQVQRFSQKSDEQIQSFGAKFEDMANEITSLAEHSKSSLGVLQQYAIQLAGFHPTYTEESLPQSKSILVEVQGAAAALCQNIVQFSESSLNIEGAFFRRWPGYAPHINKMRELGLITDEDQVRLMAIADTRRFTRDVNPEKATVADLNMATTHVKVLRDKYSR